MLAQGVSVTLDAALSNVHQVRAQPDDIVWDFIEEIDLVEYNNTNEGSID